MTVKRLIGTMSGTSMDGVDVAILETDGDTVLTPRATFFRPYTKAERATIMAALEAFQGGDGYDDPRIGDAETLVTQVHHEAIKGLLEQENRSIDEFHLVALHGQTVFHAPHQGTTVQLGDGADLAKRLGVPVAFDFRSKDVASGGEGAPLVPVFHEAIMQQAKVEGPVGVVNIGGVANVTIIRDSEPLVAFDTGPGNAPIDDWIKSRTSKKMDQWGRIAGEGTVLEEILADFLSHTYFTKAPPKSLDRNAFDFDALDRVSLADGAATLTAFAASAIALSIGPYGLKRIFVSGGGAHNRTMMKFLHEKSGLQPETLESLGFDGDFVEAYAFAYLAMRTERNLPISFPTTTGAKKALFGGRIIRPD